MEFSIRTYQAISNQTYAEIFHQLRKEGRFKDRLCSRQSIREWCLDDPQVMFVEYNPETKVLANVYRKESKKQIWSRDE